MSHEEYHDLYKIVLLGDSGVGKTNIINNFVKDVVGTQQRGPTIGIEYSSKTISIDSKHTVKAQIWDTAGQQQYRSITFSQLKKAQGAFVVFDMTSRKSFDSLPYWIKQLREKALQNVSIIIVGNKADRASSRQVSREEAEVFAKQNDAGYVEASVLDIRSLNSIFIKLTELIAYGKREEQKISPEEKVMGLPKGEVLGGQERKTNKCC